MSAVMKESHYDYSQMKGRVEMITPVMAQLYLGRSNGNRKLRESWLKGLAQIIKMGGWKVFHQGAAFDTDGVLVDGHHRLTAIVKAGVTLPLHVMRGVDKAAYQDFDRGIPRSLADSMDIEQKYMEVLRFMARIYYSATILCPEQIQTMINAGALEIIERFMKKGSKTVRGIVSSAPVRTAAVGAIMGGEDEDFVCAQYRALVIMDYDAMTPLTKAFVRQMSLNNTMTARANPLFARAAKVFDLSISHMTRLQLGPESTKNAMDNLREVIAKRLMGDL